MACERNKTHIPDNGENVSSAKRPEDTIVCYCGKNITPSMLKCLVCQKLFHSSCLKNGRPSNFKGDVFFEFTCVKCSDSGKEKCERKSMNWLQVVYLALYNLICRGSGRKGYFRWKDDLCQFIDQNWTTFHADRKRTTSWCSTVAGTLSTNCPRIFKSGQREFKEGGWWTLQEVLPPSEKGEVITPGVNPRRRKKGARTGEAGKSNNAGKKRKVDESGTVENGVSTRTAQDYKSKLIKAETKLTESEKTIAVNENQIQKSGVSKCDIADHLNSFLENNGDIMELDIGDLGAMDEIFDNLDHASDESLLGSFEEVTNSVENCELEQSEKSSVVQQGVIVLDPEDIINISQPAATTMEHDRQGDEQRSDSSKEDDQVKNLRTMKPHEERLLLEKLNTINSENPTAKRLRRKLLLNQKKRHCGQAVFDLNSAIKNSINTVSHYIIKDGDVTPVLKPTTENTVVKTKLNKQLRTPHVTHDRILDRFMMQPVSQKPAKKVSFLGRLIGCDSSAIIRSITSPYTSRVLKPFIRRDFEARPLKLKLLREVYMWFQRKFPNQELPPVDTDSIDYCYVQPHHIPGVNALCREFFWPGIDLSECLQYPDFTCVVLYKKLIIGCAFMVPDVKCNEAYISFVVVHPDWRRAGLGSFMIYHLIQTCLGKDVTLHVSANNPAMLLYQKFGFKPERFVVGFYDRYYPVDGHQSKHAFFLRLKR